MPDSNDQGDAKPGSVADGFAVFQIKNPSRSDDKFTLRIRLDATVDELRALIAQTYEGRPPPSQQTLVYAGRVLNQSTARIKDFLRQHTDSSDPATPHSLHLVVRSPPPAPAPTPSPPPAPTAASATSSLPPSQQPSTSNRSPQTPAGATPPPSAAPPASGPNPPSTPSTEPVAPPASTAPAASTSQPQQAPGGMAPPSTSSPYFLVMNPIMAAAYQAAYTAALAAAVSLHPDASRQANQAPPPGAPHALQLPPFMPPFAPPFVQVYPNPQAGMPGNPMLNQFVTFPAVPAPYGMYPMGFHHGMPYGPMPHPAGPYPNDEGAAQRAPAGRGHTIVLHAQRVRGERVVNRMRVFRFRLNLRALLQLLVFVVLFYQHFTMTRFLVLTVGALIIWLTSSWAPLRQLITSLLHPRPHGAPPPGPGPAPPFGAGAHQAPAANQQPGAAAPAPAAAADAGGQQPDQQQHPQQQAAAQGGAAGEQPEGGLAAAPQQQQQQRPPGLLREVMVLLVGFVTSLMPGWHFNPEDAAAVAAAQQALAAQNVGQQQEEQQQQDAQHPHQD